MTSPIRDTIFALSSGRPPAAIAVVRVSGPQAGDAVRALAGRLPKARQAMLARVRDPATDDTIDQAVVLWFPGPASETGEDTAEIQLHGGRAVIAATLAALSRVPGCRPAEAGEFTRRAFENGKLDLTRVEGLADLIGAETDAQRRQALRQLQGLLGDKAEAWRTRLTEALAQVEARIDFSDEADVPEDFLGPARHAAQQLTEEIEKVLADGRRGERLRDGLVVAIAGAPNAGKSSLLNTIARRDAAIVSPHAGTTRDVIEVHLDLDGCPVTLLDTAGIRDSDDPVEREGVRRARERVATADLVLWIIDAAAGGEIPLEELEREFQKTETWLIWNKIDLLSPLRLKSLNSIIYRLDYRSHFVSTRSHAGIDDLFTGLSALASHFVGAGEPAMVTRERHRRALEEAANSLRRALMHTEGQEDLVAEDLRLAGRALARLTGRIDVEDILDVIFRDFCIGK
jgi:tRNA modification GTPase